MNPKLYTKTFRQAVESDEIQKWKTSHDANIKCREYIRTHADNAYAERKVGNFINELNNQFGYERCLFVIGKCIQISPDFDVRFRRECRDRAEQFTYDDSHSRDYIISTVHNTLLNDIYEHLIDVEKESTLKFSYNNFKVQGQTFKVSYSLGPFTGQPQGTIGIYTNEYLAHPDIPGLKKYNDSAIEYDNYEKDKYYVSPDNPHYAAVCDAYNKQEKHREKVWRDYTPKYIDAEQQIKMHALGLSEPIADMGQIVPSAQPDNIEEVVEVEAEL